METFWLTQCGNFILLWQILFWRNLEGFFAILIQDVRQIAKMVLNGLKWPTGYNSKKMTKFAKKGMIFHTVLWRLRNYLVYFVWLQSF